jgi:cytochrome c
MEKRIVGLVFGALLLLAGCGRGEESRETPAQGGPPPEGGAAELTAFEVKNGIGPLKSELTVGPVNHAMAERGEKTFEAKCSACHKMAERYVGPALGTVTERRTPTYVMNMILDPEAMYTRHPEAKKLLAEHLTQMPNLGLTQDEAREVLEYLREQATKAGSH